jgi:hypothetical protein
VAPVTLDIAVVAFENAEVHAQQHEALSRHLADEHRLWVFDNSPGAAGRARIAAWAASAGVRYVALPAGNPYTGSDPSASHGLAQTWAYRHVLRPAGARYLGFLDPDVFPARRTSVLDILERQPCFGHLQQRGEAWYLWAGFAWFRADAAPRGLDFRPVPPLDTGGANWPLVFRDLDREALEFPPHSYVSADVDPGRTPERIGDWVHTFNASSWRG